MNTFTRNLTRTIASFGIAGLLSGCIIDPSAFPTMPPNGGSDGGSTGGGTTEPPPPAQGSKTFIKAITYPNGQVSYYRTDNSSQVRSGVARICLINATGQPKSIVWTKGAPSSTNNLSAKTNGSKHCANFTTNRRLEFSFRDRLWPKKEDAMNLHSFEGSLIEFHWVKDY